GCGLGIRLRGDKQRRGRLCRLRSRQVGGASTDPYGARLRLCVQARGMRLPIRARIALFGAAIVCATLVLFSVVLYLIALQGGLNGVDQDLKDGNATRTFLAVGAPDGHLQVRRPGGFGPVPDRLPVPMHQGLATITAAPNDRVRVLVQPQADGTLRVTGQHLSEVQRGTSALLTYMLFTAFVTMLAGVAAPSACPCGRGCAGRGSPPVERCGR